MASSLDVRLFLFNEKHKYLIVIQIYFNKQRADPLPTSDVQDDLRGPNQVPYGVRIQHCARI